MGMVPLWYFSENKYTVLSPEFKSFCALQNFQFDFKPKSQLLKIEKRKSNYSPFTNVKKFPARSKISFDQKAKMTVHELPVLDFNKRAKLAEQSHIDNIEKSLEVSFQSLPRNKKWGSFLSGGIDSSLATSLIRRKSDKRVLTLTLGSSLASQFELSKKTARQLDVETNQLICNADDLLNSFKEVIWCNEVFDGLTAEILAQINFMTTSQILIQGNIKRIVTGYGADLIYGGMLEHQEYLAAVGVSNERDLIERTYWTHEFSPFYHWRNNIQLHHLYWHPSVIQFGQQTPLEMNNRMDQKKFLLRKLSVQKKWLDEDFAFNKKVAMTDGTRAHILLSRVLKLSDDYNFVQKTEFAVSYLQSRLKAETANRKQSEC